MRPLKQKMLLDAVAGLAATGVGFLDTENTVYSLCRWFPSAGSASDYYFFSFLLNLYFQLSADWTYHIVTRVGWAPGGTIQQESR